MDSDDVSSLTFLDVRVVNDIKRRLMSRNPQTQNGAVAVLEQALLREPLVDSSLPLREFILDQDVMGFLCDAMATSCRSLLGRIAVVLEMLSDSDRMLLEGHAVLAAESATRRAHFLVLNLANAPNAATALGAILGLITTLLNRWCEVHRSATISIANLCPTESLVSTLHSVLARRPSASSLSAETLQVVSRTVSVLLQSLSKTKDAEEVPCAISTCTHDCLQRLEEALRDLDSDDSSQDSCDNAEFLRLDIASMICSICSGVIRLQANLSQYDMDDVGAKGLEDVEKDAVEKVLQHCIPIVMQCVKGSAWEYNACDAPSSLAPLVMESMQVALDLWGGQAPGELATTLAQREFLHLLPALHKDSVHGGDPVRLLGSILAVLADEMLDACSWWEGDVTLAAHLGSSAAHLPADPNKWPQLLADLPYTPLGPARAPEHNKGRSAAQHIVLLLMYFRCVVSTSDWDPVTTLTLPISTYVMSLPLSPGPDLPCVVLKTAWLSVALCTLSVDCPSKVLQQANQRLVDLLEQLPRLEAAYTHNSSILFWAFQDTAVTPRIQRNVCTLWLSREESVSIIVEMVRCQREALFPLLDVVTAGETPVAQRAAEALSHCLGADLSDAVWRVLPSALLRCTQDRADSKQAAVGAGLLLCLVASPQALSSAPASDAVLRVSHQLSLVIGRSKLEHNFRFHAAALTVAENILRDARRRCDPRVLTTFLSDARLCEKIPQAVKHVEGKVSAAALRLLCAFLDCQGPVKGQGSARLDDGVLLARLASNDLEVVGAALELLVLGRFPQGCVQIPPLVGTAQAQKQPVLEPRFEVPAVAVELNDVRTLFLRLQQLCCKISTEPASSRIWCSLTKLLSISPDLALQAWTHALLRFTLSKPIEDLGEDVLRFLATWLQGNPKLTCSSRKAKPLGTTMLTESSRLIGAALLKSSTEFQQQPLPRVIAKSLLTVNADIPQDTLDAVRKLTE